MEDYVGKVCPVCKQKINEQDTVMVCPDCDMPHHADCWEMNGGCSTFACAQQGTVKTKESMETCTKCGTVFNEGQAFCAKCGTPRGGVKKNVCGKCGAELQEGQEFCSKCGQKAGLIVESNVSTAINQFNAGVEEANAKKKKAPLITAVSIVVLVLLVIVGIILAPKIFMGAEGYMEQGNYEKAYQKAKKDDDKLAVQVENLVAVQSAFAADNLKDPSSFSLRDAYYLESTDSDGKSEKNLVLYISGANSYGASVSSYWLFIWDADDREWEYYTSVSDLSKEDYESWDDSDEMIEKLLNNMARDDIKEAMNSGFKLKKDSVKRINRMFEEDVLDEVELIETNEE